MLYPDSPTPDASERGKSRDFPPSGAPVELPSPESLLEGLTADQAAAVAHVDGPLLVIAGPGSGKTRVITRRIAFLVASGVPAWNILALTFTNKAAGEMKARVQAMLPADLPGRRGLVVSTFHAFCAMFLRRHAAECGVDPEFVIYDTDDQRAAAKSAIAECGLDSTNFTPAAVLGRISALKNQLLDSQAAAEAAGDYSTRQVAKAYAAYERVLARHRALDFDDLLMRTAQALERNLELRAQSAQRYRYLLIDEYQDTNRAQFAIARWIAGEHRNICVVGDPDQSIYRWRGADIRNILEFEESFGGARTVALGENFRSTGHIVAAADGLIRHNRRRRAKPLYTSLPEGERVRVLRCGDEHAEADEVSRAVVEAQGRGVPWRSMAVLYRMNALSRVVEDALRRRQVPYRIVRGTAFFERKEVKDLLAYLRLVSNPADDVACARIVNVPPRGIGDSSVERIERLALVRKVPLLAALSGAREAGVAERSAKRVDEFAQLVARWRALLDGRGAETLAAFVEMVLEESGLRDFDDGAEGDDLDQRRANLDEVVSAAGDLELPADAPPTLRAALQAFLQSVALVADTDALDAEAGAVTLMTLHAAKGLEFDLVAVVGCEEGLLPHARSREGDEDIEEERRLCFVGMTRARRRLLLTHAARRAVRGLRQSCIESPFLQELPEAAVERQDLATTWLDGDDADPPSPDDDGPRGRGLASQFPVGCTVRHALFGVGTVQAVLPRGSVTSVRVAFRTVGVKTLVLEYAKLQRA
ncbi:MAG: UvrD-helicase domain-containing protein [Phycisphaerales bacterium]